jgi:calreticulin
MKVFAIVILGLIACATAEVYYKETFHNLDSWVQSKFKGSEAGKVELSAGKYYGDAEEDKGMKTTQDARFYQLSSKMPKEFSNEGKDLVFQFSVKHEQNIDCGGGYFKILPKGLDQENFNGDSEYNIMFGPDICGSSTKKTHVIFSNKGKNHLVKKDIKCKLISSLICIP